MNNNSEYKNYFPQRESLTLLFLLLLALIVPFFLLPLEKWIGSDVIIEEACKLFIILIASYFILSRSIFFISAIIFGLFFAWTENILYLNNFILSGVSDQFWARCLLTSSLHVWTTVVAAVFICGNKKRYFFPLALALNIITHYLFNNYLNW